MNRLEQFADSNAVSSNDSSSTFFAEYQQASLSKAFRMPAQNDTFDPTKMSFSDIYDAGKKIGQDLADGKTEFSASQYNADWNAINGLKTTQPDRYNAALSSFVQGIVQADPTDAHYTANSQSSFDYAIDFTTEEYVNQTLDMLSKSTQKPSVAAADMTVVLHQTDLDAKNPDVSGNHYPIDHAVFIEDFNRRRAQDKNLQDYVACPNRTGGVSIVYLGMNDVAPPVNSKM